MSLPTLTKEDIGFRSLDASKLSFVEQMKNACPGKDNDVCPIIDTVKHTITRATFQKHFKFAINAYACPKQEDATYEMLMVCLMNWCDIPQEMFANGGEIVKCGLISFPHNEYDASIRLWCSKQVGKSVIYELTVSAYKDAVPQPTGNKPIEKKVIKGEY